MRAHRRPVVLAASLGLALTAALVAPGPAPGVDARARTATWTKVTSGNVVNIAEPGLYRTSDGVLHLVYLRQGPSSDTLAFTSIGAGGVTATGVAVGGWAALPQDPKVVGVPGGGMRLVFGGIRTTSGGDPYGTGQMFSATADAAGATWPLAAGALTASGYAIDSYGTGATTLADGTPVVSFPLNSTLTWNAGGSPADSTYTFGECCVYDSTLARDGDEVWVAFAANGSSAATAGLFVKRLLPTVGPTTKVPRSSEGSNTLTPSQSTAFVARPGGGLYVAYCVGYPTCTKVGLWRVGSDRPRMVRRSAGARDIAIATGPGGRLWIAWTTYDAVKVVHTGATGVHFSAVRTLKPPRAAPDLYGITIAGTNRSVDLVINNGSALFHRRVGLR